MRRFIRCASVALMLVAINGVSAQTRVVTSSSATTYVCPKCGKLHTRQPAVATKSPVASTETPASGSSSERVTVRRVSVDGVTSTGAAPVAATSAIRASGGVANVLGALNAQRARRGIRALLFDPQLQAVAQRRAQRMAASGIKNHPPGSFAPGRYEGVGWSSSYSPSGVSACFTSDTRMRYAGAAMATGRDGVYFAVVYR